MAIKISGTTVIDDSRNAANLVTANITSNLIVGGAITENTNGTYYNVATQFDIGTAPNQIPLNQYLGTMAFQDAAGISVGVVAVSGNLTTAGTINTATANITTIVTGNTLNLSTGVGSNSNVVISANGTEYVRVTNVGNVAIGTLTPASVLHINATQPTVTLSGNAINQFESGRIRFTESVGTFFQGTFIHYDGANNRLNLGVNASADANTANDSNAITIQRSDANVGIGQVTPAYKLDVTGDIRATSNLIANNILVGTGAAGSSGGDNNLVRPAGASAFLNLKGGSGRSKITLGNDLLNVISGAANIVLATDATSSTDGGTTRMFIANGSGNVGIGTSNPTSNLHVVGNVSITNALAPVDVLNLNNNNIVGVNNIRILDPGPNEGIAWDSGNLWTIWESPNDLITNSAGNLQFANNGVRRFTLNSSGSAEFTGNVGIGISTPTSNLHVIGTANITSNVIVNGITSTGNVTLNTVNIITDTTTGTKIGTDTSQKLGFFNAAPVVQQSGTGETVGFTQNAGTAVNDSSTFTGNIGSTAYRINDIVKALKNLGLLAQ